MRVKSNLGLSYSECLKVIEKFGVRVAQSIVGGVITKTNHSGGDLFHVQLNSFTEVKACGLSHGPIIREEQVGRQIELLETNDLNYAIVMYKDRGQFLGKYCSLPIRMGKNEAALELFLARSTKEIYVIHVSVIHAIFKSEDRRGNVKEHNFKHGGYRRLLRLYPGRLRKIVENLYVVVELGLDPTSYNVERELRIAKFRNFKIPVMVSRIERRQIVEDDSFDVETLEAKPV